MKEVDAAAKQHQEAAEADTEAPEAADADGEAADADGEAAEANAPETALVPGSGQDKSSAPPLKRMHQKRL